MVKTYYWNGEEWHKVGYNNPLKIPNSSSNTNYGYLFKNQKKEGEE